MKIGLVAQPGSSYARELARAAGERGHHATPIEFPSLVGSVGTAESGLSAQGLDLLSLDAVIVRTMPPGSLEQIVYRMDALWRLSAAGVRVLNSPKALECAVDKYLALVRMESAGLTVPSTIVCENADMALEAFDRLGGDVVVKPIFGSEGRGIVRVSDREIAARTFRTLERIQAVPYVQRFVENDGFDLRVLVLGGHVLGAMRRRANGDFRANVACRAVAEKHAITDQETQAALGAALAVGARFAGVDLLYGRDGTCYVIEVNAVPGWRAFQRVTEIDVPRAVIANLESHGA
jgi:RimK family alpha-L-glutamate ligase